MLKLSEELAKIVLVNRYLKHGVQRRIFNFRALARILRPHLEEKLQKPLSEGSIHVALTRLKVPETEALPQNVEPDMELGNLFLACFSNEAKARIKVHNWVSTLRKHHDHLWVQESKKEIRVLLPQTSLEPMSHELPVKPKLVHTNLRAKIYTSQPMAALQSLSFLEGEPSFIAQDSEGLLLVE